MSKLIYIANVSLDGYIEDSDGNFDWTTPNDELFAFITDLVRSSGTYLYGRRMYEAMAVWETDPALAAQSELRSDFAHVWQAANKVVYSTTLHEVSTAKTQLERFSRALSAQELNSVLELGVISCIVLPLLPDRGYGPWGAWNPFDIWLVVILVSAFSFVGFIASRLLGERRGLLVAGLGGALVSSTAVTVAMAQRSRAEPALERSAAMASALASAVMALRVTVLAGAAGAGILPRLLPAVGAMAVLSLLAAWVIGRPRDAEGGALRPALATNPFSLWAALSFALLFAVVLLLVPAARAWLGATGSFAAATIASLVDVDAMTIAISRDGPTLGGWRDPAAAVSTGIAVNTLVKTAIVAVVGRGRFRAAVVSSLLLAALGCLALAALVYFWPFAAA